MRNECDDRASCRQKKYKHIGLWQAKCLATVFLCMFSLLSSAQQERSNFISFGHTSILDTYLSQEKADGFELRYTWQKANRKPAKNGNGVDSTALRHWSSFVAQDAFVSSAGTRGNDNTFIGAMYNLRFGWHYNFDFLSSSSPVPYDVAQQHPTPRPLNLRLGVLADFSLGGLYNTRNSNNPAQARASLNVDPSVMASWHFRIKGKPFALHYEAAMPIMGIAFSPNYGQSYYEIFTRGNYDHNVVFLSPFTGVQFRQMLTFDFRLWRTTFSVGYLGDYRQMDVNNLKYHQYSHNFVIGWRY